MASTTTGEATRNFLAAWEAAGCPPVQKLLYPQFGRGRDKVLFDYSEIRLFAEVADATFYDNGEDVKICWSYTDDSFDGSGGGSAELYFDRANPIQAGRTGEEA